MTPRLRLLSLFLAIGFGAALLHVSGPSGCSANCGNGVIDEGETCDDNNKDDGDGCSADCELETDGTTGGSAGGGTTGGTTTGGTTAGGSAGGGTGGSDGTTCTTAADCDESFSSAPVCRTPATCQGDRRDAACTKDGICISIRVPDDSACTASSFTRDCGTDNAGGSCDGTVSQTEPLCEKEICDDGPIPPNVNDDDDGDGLVNCLDTSDCINGGIDAAECTQNAGFPGHCFSGNCSD